MTYRWAERKKKTQAPVAQPYFLRDLEHCSVITQWRLPVQPWQLCGKLAPCKLPGFSKNPLHRTHLVLDIQPPWLIKLQPTAPSCICTSLLSNLLYTNRYITNDLIYNTYNQKPVFSDSRSNMDLKSFSCSYTYWYLFCFLQLTMVVFIYKQWVTGSITFLDSSFCFTKRSTLIARYKCQKALKTNTIFAALS